MSERDAIDRFREIIEPAVQRAADTGEAQAVDVTDVAADLALDVDVEALALVQRAVDASVRGTALSGYVTTFPMGGGSGLGVVIRGVPDRAAT